MKSHILIPNFRRKETKKMSLARSCVIPFDDVFEFTFALGLFDIGDIMKLQMVATQYDIHFLKQKFRISPQVLSYPENEYCNTNAAF